MKNIGRPLSIAFLLIGLLTSCVEPYNPPESNDPNIDILVVDGFIDATAGSVTVSLTKALPLNSEVRRIGVNGAVVKVISDDGVILQLFEQPVSDEESTGYYKADGLTIDLSKKYKLHIERDFSKVYESDLVAILESPEIEDVYFKAEEDALEIYVDSKLAEDKSRYYRWKYQEVYEYHAPYTSSYIYEGGEIKYRQNTDELNVCYSSDLTSQILLGSTDNLAQNIVTQKLINSIDRSSMKLSYIYSINVQQFSLSEEEYTYWYNVDQMTESMGGLFDPMPGQVIGNIRNINDISETVIGYFSGSTVQQKRIFIKRWDLPDHYATFSPRLCEVDTVLNENLGFIPVQNMLIGAVTFPPSTSPAGYTMSDRLCIDCMEYGDGVPVKPEFWP
jgi:hypothetical protein